MAGPHIQAIQISCQLCSNVDIKDSWANQILQMAHKNFKCPLKFGNLNGIWAIGLFKGPSSFWARFITDVPYSVCEILQFCMITPPTLKKLRGILLWACLCMHVSVRWLKKLSYSSEIS